MTDASDRHEGGATQGAESAHAASSPSADAELEIWKLGLQISSKLDVKDTVEKWCEAEVTAVDREAGEVFISYMYWSSKVRLSAFRLVSGSARMAGNSAVLVWWLSFLPWHRQRHAHVFMVKASGGLCRAFGFALCFHECRRSFTARGARLHSTMQPVLSYRWQLSFRLLGSRYNNNSALLYLKKED